jgi:hypothetical protein
LVGFKHQPWGYHGNLTKHDDLTGWSWIFDLAINNWWDLTMNNGGMKTAVVGISWEPLCG